MLYSTEICFTTQKYDYLDELERVLKYGFREIQDHIAVKYYIIFQFIVQLNIIIIIIIILTLLLCVACCPLFIYLSPVNNVRHVLSLLTVVCGVLNT